MFKSLCYNLLSDAIPYVTLCGTIVDIVDHENHLGNNPFDNIYKRDMKVCCRQGEGLGRWFL